jgi:hypothetical protein
MEDRGVNGCGLNRLVQCEDEWGLWRRHAGHLPRNACHPGQSRLGHVQPTRVVQAQHPAMQWPLNDLPCLEAVSPRG